MTELVADYVNHSGLFVAGRGDAATDGLHFFSQSGGQWSGTQLAEVTELAALCWHPTLSVIYGLSGLGAGLLHAWDVREAHDAIAASLVTTDCVGEIPCDLAVDPTGRMLVAANFGTDDGGGSLSVWMLDAAGVPLGAARTVPLGDGSGVRGFRQERSHPHQIVFRSGRLFVPDYGADRVRVFDVDAAAGQLTERDPLLAPPGSAPRHLAFVGESDRFVASAELGGAILSGQLGSEMTANPGTRRSGPASGRHPINYPGDIKVSGDLAYFANRGYDTIAVFDVSVASPEFVAEVDSGVLWAQHLLVHDEHLLVAGWDSGTVAIAPLVRGIPGAPTVLFDCPGAGWLLAGRP